ncbi:lipoate--protein ligase [Photobacterium sp. SDRW27]|uniref:lipoyl protein ligase domain-containing protein n=1 Tax=Photobacterium obscurum TaxID=2829490 RepID=UPI0022437090|nr:lipoate protein ligase C-terminal domain-containing protein [Photobacterium obscurum]MCW8329933.1 lipoate--protein ligase [Photobacterium obscurum]
MELQAYLSQSQNPWFNQAIEEITFDNIEKNKLVLFIWQNRQSINIGRDQNPWNICNTRHAHQNHVSIVRRQTPGGAIYQDPGHTNFSLMGSTEQLSLSNIEAILQRLLTSLKINASIAQQKEIVANNRKISNTTSITVGDNTLIHSTIRVNTNLSVVDEYMTSNHARALSDVIDNYSNLSELNATITHAVLQRELVNAFCRNYGCEVDTQYIQINPLPPLPGLGEKLHFISSWDWNYGQSPKFCRQIKGRFSWGKVTLTLQVVQGTIIHIQCHSSQRYCALFNNFANRLIGYPYQAKSVMPVICTMMVDFSANHTELLEFANWLENELS